MAFSLGVKELCSKGVKTLVFSFILLPSGRSGGGCLFILGEVGRGLPFSLGEVGRGYIKP